MPLRRRALTWLLTLALLILADHAQAAPQILGIVASNGLPTPLHCANGYCSGYLASFCLQEARHAPNSGSEYKLAPGGNLTILATTSEGATLRLPGERLLAIRSRSGFTSLWVSMAEDRLRQLGAVAAAVEVGADTTVLPVAGAEDPQPQSAAEIGAASGPLRKLAAETFDAKSEAADTARLIQLVINDLPAGSKTAGAVPLSTVWNRVAAEARQRGADQTGLAAAGRVVAECQGGKDGAGSFAGGVCLEMRQAELMTDLNRRYWDQAAGGS
jgi:hypothetical protein